MSVPKGKRNTGKLEVITKSSELLEYTYRSVNNDKNISKRYKYSIGNDVTDTALAIHNNILFANNIKVDSNETCKLRLMYQQNALNNLSSLASLLDMCFNMFKIENSTQSNWAKLISKVQSLLKGWIKSDEIRYNQYNT